MNKLNLKTLLALVGFQLVLVGIYVVVDQQDQQTERREVSYVTTQWVEPMDESVRSFEVERADGSVQRVQPGQQLILVHFWATWCPTCVDEMPQLLEETSRRDIEVVAVAVEDEWAKIERFFDRDVPDEIVRSPGGSLSKRLRVRELPQTVIIGADGRATMRWVGPRDWRHALDELP